MDLKEHITSRMKQLKDERRQYETGLWVDISRFVNPRREDISQDTLGRLKGQRRGKDVYDGTPGGALNTWADGMQGFLVSEALAWFRSEMADFGLNEIDEVLEWLQYYDMAMYSAFRRSNFYAVIGQWFRDAGSIGTATLYMEEDIVHRCVVFTTIHPREVFIAENKFGQVDTVYRNFMMTARQALDKFKDKVSKAIKDNAVSNPEKNHEFVHAVFPNTDRLPDGLASNNKKFRSVYLEVGNEVVRDSGYDINPYAVWRFRKNSDEVYGYSPAADAIVEVFSLNQFGKTLIEAAQKSVQPPVNVPSEMRGHVRLTPSGYNYYDDPNRVITAVQERINYPVGIDQLERLQRSIEDKYRVEFFLMLARATREMTRYEVMERKGEKAVLLGPQVDQLYTEGLKKVFDIVSDIEDKGHRLPMLPPILRTYGGSINVTLTGPLAQAQKRLFKMQPIQDAINEIAPLAVTFPEVRYKIKAMEVADEILEATNFPETLTRSNEEATAMYQKDVQEQQQQKMMETAGAAAGSYKGLTKKPEPGSPAEAIMGAMK